MTHTHYCTLVLLLAMLASCSKDTGLIERLEQLASSNVGRSVDISAAVPLAWDEVAVFGAYYPKQDACKLLNLSGWGCFWLGYPEPDDSSPSVIAFLSKGELVATSALPRCRIEVTLREGVKAERGTARFVSSRSYASCKQGVPRLTQE